MVKQEIRTCVTRTTGPPLWCTTYSSSHSNSVTVNATYVPHPLNTGFEVEPGASVMRRGTPPVSGTVCKSSSHTNTRVSRCSAGQRKYPDFAGLTGGGIGVGWYSTAQSLDAVAVARVARRRTEDPRLGSAQPTPAPCFPRNRSTLDR